MVDIPFGDYILLRQNGSRRLIMAFSGIGCERGKFSYFQTFAASPHDILLLNSPGNGWFFGGIPLSADSGDMSLQSTLAFLHALAAEYDEVILFGGSMGGYGALLYGSFFPNAHVLSLAPEIYPGIRQGHFVAHSKSSDLPLALSALFLRNRSFAPHILVGEKMESDLFNFGEIISDRIYAIRNGYHNLAPMLIAVFGRIDTVMDHLVAGTLGKALQPYVGQMYHHPELSAHMYYMRLGRVPLSRSIAYFHALSPDSYVRAYLAVRIAAELAKQNDVAQALDFAKLAKEANPGDLEAHALYDRLHLKQFAVLPDPTYQDHLRSYDLVLPLYKSAVDELTALHSQAAPA